MRTRSKTMEENLKEKKYLLEKIQDLEEKLQARDLETSSLKKISDDQQTEITVLTNENTKLKSIIKSQTEEPEKISQCSENINDRHRTHSAGSSGSVLSSQAGFQVLVFYSKLGCVVRMVIDSVLPCSECRPNDYRKDASPFIVTT